ncbi:conserved hypothetical protein [Sulfurihydrogenibium azorense Az-Fu1]|uniref:Probable inorganic carbon transporter subunit DabA n=1 Tax=Sulfurihydrogenibium azorense (strain DSM 15241 / OCM 825 / Az-Fu1) TaxID=204536 RepID=DABA_SULAA|nr:putative inorganic carbon transporter subunit DabA [Sulfurihydrogenibium azorense]C1DU51.1 RecName: Full=Probable inorganic carbon transporter subunit DabA [Sulfurihydrogenibium azorense Az-Fu1]ACN98964.1 conserved hypothetical protein [Sulfurihydrogenibium azorense Az-Fu1]
MKTVALKEASSILPKYWPLTMFVHHNPLHELESLHFKQALKIAKDLFDAKVYMDPSYYVDLYRKGKVRKDSLEKNIEEFLRENNFNFNKYKVRKFLTDISPSWKEYKEESFNNPSIKVPDYLLEYIKKDKGYDNLDNLFYTYIKKYLFSEILDILFDQNIYNVFFNDAVEFISRFLDEGQTSITLPFREQGYWNCFRQFYKLDKHPEDIIEEFENTFQPPSLQDYARQLYIRFFGWSSFIKFRESTPFYPYQEEFPINLEDFGSSLLYLENQYIQELNKSKIKNYFDLMAFYKENKYYVILKLFEHRKILTPKYISKLYTSKDYDNIFNKFINEEIESEAKAIVNLSTKVFDKSDYLQTYNLVKTLKEDEECYLWIKSLEDSYALNFGREFIKEYQIDEKPKAFAVFCVDVRSEALRRNLERVDNYKTFGVAGFFGVKMALIEFDKAHELLLCPAMEIPDKVVLEVPTQKTQDYEKRKKLLISLKKILEGLKNNPYTPFFAVESFGWLFGYKLFGKTLFPSVVAKIDKKIKPKPPKTFYMIDKLSEKEVDTYTDKFFYEKIYQAFEKEGIKIKDCEVKDILSKLKNNENISQNYQKVLNRYRITKQYYDYIYNRFSNIGYTLDEQVILAENFLRLIGMVEDFPEFVLLVGHGSVSDNNPYESALDCGACGGNSGYHNVRAMCMILNKKEVREKLSIRIPDGTIFIPGLHNTTTDEIEFYDEDLVPENSLDKWEEIKKDFKKAGEKTRIERLSSLPYADNPEDVIVRSIDWSEMRPEWGLSKNLGVFVGKSESRINSVLKNRFFLHSYDYKIDVDNSILKRILNGPLLIAQWINAEHYFSTVDNEKFGSGSKVYHNVVSRIGVFSGNYSDLKIGLPYQTVYVEDRPFHEPIRLIAFVEAPLEKVVEAASQTDHPMMLVKNEWIRLVVIDKEKNKVFLFSNGNFVEL